MSEMGERVAKAMWENRREVHGNYPDDGPWEKQCEMTRDWVLSDARAAIAAMREPTEAMVAAALDDDARGIWYDMIDAALPHDR